MFKIRFELLKNRAVREFKFKAREESALHNKALYIAQIEAIDLQRHGQKLKHPFKIFEEWLAYGETLIDSWDVRCARALIRLFPNIIPQKYQNSHFLCEYDENGNWILIFS